MAVCAGKICLLGEKKIVLNIFTSLGLRAALFGVVLAMSACADQSLNYTQPSGLSAQNAGAIIGSDSEPTGRIDTTTIRTYVVGIDNQLTNTGPRGWQTPMFVTPGTHILQIGACVHDFMGCGGFGFVTFAPNFEAGKTYVLRASQAYLDGHGPFKPAVSDVWVEDATGIHVTSSAKLVYGGAAPAVVPIFIPVH